MGPVLLLVWVRVVMAAAGQADAILANTEFVGTLAVVSSATVVINLLLNAVLIPSMGANGAAIATSISYLVMTICNVSILRNRIGISSLAGLGK